MAGDLAGLPVNFLAWIHRRFAQETIAKRRRYGSELPAAPTFA
jgi:hypothetical protein